MKLIPNSGERIWGRGSSDDKNGLIGTMYEPSSVLSSRIPMLGKREVAAAAFFTSSIGRGCVLKPEA